jgi:uncharacterized protein (TIGR00251 family)
MIKLREKEGGIVVSVKIQPNSSKDRVIGEYADRIKVAVTVAPEKGKANKAVIKIFSKWLGVKSSDIQIISGEKSRIIFIEDNCEALGTVYKKHDKRRFI